MNDILAIRCDASEKIGAGHLMRCLALASAWQERGGIVYIIAAEMPTHLGLLIEGHNIDLKLINVVPGSVEDIRSTYAAAKAISSTYLVIDGYDFDKAYIESLSNDFEVLAIDDLGSDGFAKCAFVLNHGAYALPDMYPNHRSETKLLLGLNYLLLRKEFWRTSNTQLTISEKVETVFISFGYSSRLELLQLVCGALDTIFDSLVSVVVAAGNLSEDVIVQLSKYKFKIHFESGSTNMHELLTKCDLAILAGGVTAYEAVAAGVPTAVIAVADNQVGNVEALDRLSAVVNLGLAENLTINSIEKKLRPFCFNLKSRLLTAQAGTKLIDGFGPRRVVSRILKEPVFLRPIRLEDADLIFGLISDYETEANDLSSSITTSEHTNWLSQKLRDSKSLMYIAESEQMETIGLIRFDLLTKQETSISIIIAANFRTKEFMANTIRYATLRYLQSSTANRVVFRAPLKDIGIARIFENAGYSKVSHPISDSLPEGMDEFFFNSESALQ